MTHKRLVGNLVWIGIALILISYFALNPPWRASYWTDYRPGSLKAILLLAGLAVFAGALLVAAIRKHVVQRRE